MTDPTPDKLTDEQREALQEAREKANREWNEERGAAQEARERATVTALPVRQQQSRLSIRPDQEGWDPEQIQALMDHCGLRDVPAGDAYAFLHLCQRSQLDPWAREIYLIGRKERVNGQERVKYTAQTGIDGFRVISHRTGEDDGMEGPWWCGPDGQWKEVWLADEPPAAARVTILRRGRAPRTATAVYREFVPMKQVWEGTGNARRPKKDENGKIVEEPQGLWAKMPAHMLAKCAEALGRRMQYPREAAGIYVDEEMAQADARAENEAAADAERQRADLRRQLASRPWDKGPGDAASPADTAPGEVVQGQVVDVPDRDALLAELDEQARVLATTPAALARRAVAMHRKNLEDFDAHELEAVVSAYRAEAAQAPAPPAGHSVHVGTAREDPAGAARPPREADPGPGRGNGPGTRTTPQGPAQGPAAHPYAPNPLTGLCMDCEPGAEAPADGHR